MRKLILPIVAVLAISLMSSLADHHKPSVVGIWHGIGDLPDGGTSESTLTIKKKDGKLTAVSVSDQGVSTPVDRVKFADKKLTVEVDVEQDGQSGIIGVEAKLDDKGQFKGNWFIRSTDGSYNISNPWKGFRSLSPMLGGSWNITAETDQGENKHVIDFSKSNSSFTASVRTEDGNNYPFSKVNVSKNKLKLEIPFGEGTIKIAAYCNGKNSMMGEWTLFDSSDLEASSGQWKAAKQASADSSEK